jgi:hypothetical protein
MDGRVLLQILLGRHSVGMVRTRTRVFVRVWRGRNESAGHGGLYQIRMANTIFVETLEGIKYVVIMLLGPAIDLEVD